MQNSRMHSLFFAFSEEAYYFIGTLVTLKCCIILIVVASTDIYAVCIIFYLDLH